jgi:hypothetical protein
MSPRPNAAARAKVRLKNGSENEYGNEHRGGGRKRGAELFLFVVVVY